MTFSSGEAVRCRLSGCRGDHFPFRVGRQIPPLITVRVFGNHRECNCIPNVDRLVGRLGDNHRQGDFISPLCVKPDIFGRDILVKLPNTPCASLVEIPTDNLMSLIVEEKALVFNRLSFFDVQVILREVSITPEEAAVGIQRHSPGFAVLSRKSNGSGRHVIENIIFAKFLSVADCPSEESHSWHTGRNKTSEIDRLACRDEYRKVGHLPTPIEVTVPSQKADAIHGLWFRYRDLDILVAALEMIDIHHVTGTCCQLAHGSHSFVKITVTVKERAAVYRPDRAVESDAFC